MQRVEPRELVAAASAALAPAVAWAAGGSPDLTGVPAQAGVWVWVPADVRTWTILVGLAVWCAGYGGWRFARSLGVGPAGAAALALVAQLGPWSLLAGAEGDLVGLGLGAALLGVAHPALGVVLGGWSPAVALTIAVAAALRRRWIGLGALVVAAGLASTRPSAPPPAPEVGPSTPTYAAEGGAWFPLPPAEARSWRVAAAAYDGRWVHPLSPAAGGSESVAMPTQALPLAVATAVVPAAPTPWAPDPRRFGGMGVVAVAVPLLVALSAAALRWRGVAAALLVAVAVASGALVRDRSRGGGPEPLDVDLLTGAHPADVVFPCPDAPWFGGRWEAAALREHGIGPAPAAADPVLTELARLSGYGLDSRAAERASAHPKVGLAAALAAVPGGVLVDTRALPGWGWARARRELEAAGARVEGEGGLVWVGPPVE